MEHVGGSKGSAIHFSGKILANQKVGAPALQVGAPDLGNSVSVIGK